MGQPGATRIPACSDGLPWRGPGDTPRPAAFPVPPERMALVRDGRPLKRWRYVGVYGPGVMLCAGVARVAGVAQAFWAVWDRADGALHERTVLRRGGVGLPDGGVRVRDRRVTIDLVLEAAGDPVEVLSAHGRSYAWTRKQPVRAQGAVVLGSRRIAVRARGLVDDSAGYHARRTAWDWCAGTGRTPAGHAVTWNLVAGVHDGPRSSERTVWLDGAAREVPPAPFSVALDAVGDLRFAAEAQRARHDRLVLVESWYRQPFGTFSGSLPGGVVLAEGFGVMERHRARW